MPASIVLPSYSEVITNPSHSRMELHNVSRGTGKHGPLPQSQPHDTVWRRRPTRKPSLHARVCHHAILTQLKQAPFRGSYDRNREALAMDDSVRSKLPHVEGQ
jgi:hypothetical protein